MVWVERCPESCGSFQRTPANTLWKSASVENMPERRQAVLFDICNLPPLPHPVLPRVGEVRPEIVGKPSSLKTINPFKFGHLHKEF